MGKVTANKGEGYDVLFVSGQFAQALKALGIADTLDHAKLPNLANLYPEGHGLKHDPGNTFSVPYAWGTTGLCYRSDLVKAAPTSWNDLLEAHGRDHAARSTMLATDRWLLAAGHARQGLSRSTRRIRRSSKTSRPPHRGQGRRCSPTTTRPSIRSSSPGEALLVQAWDGWCNYGITENKDIKYVVPKEGSDLWVDTMVVVASSKHKDAAHAFINFILDASNGKWVVENILYKVPNKAAMEAIDPSRRRPIRTSASLRPTS